MALRFEQDTIGQLRAALIQTALHTARDYQRRLHVRKRDVAGSLDETRSYEDGGEYNPWEAEVATGGDWTSEQALGRIGAQRHPRRDREDPERQPARRDRHDLGRV